MNRRLNRNKYLFPLGPESLSTRAKRRRVLRALLDELNEIRDAEDAYMQRIPANLKSSTAYCAASDCVDILTDTIIFLFDVFE